MKVRIATLLLLGKLSEAQGDSESSSALPRNSSVSPPSCLFGHSPAGEHQGIGRSQKHLTEWETELELLKTP